MASLDSLLYLLKAKKLCVLGINRGASYCWSEIEYCICNVISYNYYSLETLINQSNSDSKFDVKSLTVYKEVLNCVFMYHST